MADYGPSDWTERPEETRRTKDVPNADPKMKQVAIWGPEDLVRKDIEAALASKEVSPLGMMGLSHELSKVYKDRGKLEQLVKDNVQLVTYACQQFKKIPSDFIRKEGKSHRAFIAAESPAEYADDVLQKLDTMEHPMAGKLASPFDPAPLKDILDITSIYLDKQKKGTLE